MNDMKKSLDQFEQSRLAKYVAVGLEQFDQLVPTQYAAATKTKKQELRSSLARPTEVDLRRNQVGMFEVLSSFADARVKTSNVVR